MAGISEIKSEIRSLILKIRHNNKSILGALAGWRFRRMGVAVSRCLAPCSFHAGHMGWNYSSFWLSQNLTRASMNYVSLVSVVPTRWGQVGSREHFKFCCGCKYSKDAKKWFLRLSDFRKENRWRFSRISGFWQLVDVCGRLLVLPPRGLICAQCSCSQTTERSSQWWNPLFFSPEKKPGLGKVLGHIALEKKHLSVISAPKGIFWDVYILPVNIAIMFCERRDVGLTADLEGAPVTLAPVFIHCCRSSQTEIETGKTQLTVRQRGCGALPVKKHSLVGALGS